MTELRPDITIFSNSLRKVILIELTRHCKENMESWHGTEINKYLALSTVIESNGWHVELLVGVLYVFKKLNFNDILITNTIKKVSKSSMECSFCIWLAGNNKDWAPSASNCKLIHKGNTSYTNYILQILSVMPTLWNRVPLESNTLLLVLRAISLNMAIKNNSTNPVDPPNFSWALT